MIDDPIARDFSAVRTPVLSTLIQHELFRIKLAAVFGAPARKVRGYNCDHDKRRATMRAKMHDRWEEVFDQVGGRAGTTQLAVTAGRPPMSVHGSLHTLESDGLIVRDGVMAHRGGGRDQVIWKWVGNDKA